ncbi:MAG: type VI secretion system tip protein VgrG, partial [Enterobacteriaceae bacterium]|nr:type VI secretion system tip protein VgrG [Enterobacteriaceae bacterium]
MNTLSPYLLEIWKSPFSLDVLNFRGREALSEPFSYVIEVTSPLADIPPEQVLNKFATFRMQPNSFTETGNAQSGKNVHGIVSHFTRLSTSA